MPDSLTPTEWFIGHFGSHSLAVMKALVSAGKEAHLRSLDAKEGSRLPSNDAYGATFWLSLPEEIASHLSFLPGSEVVHPSRSRYDLVVFENAMIFPSKMGSDSGGPDYMKLRPSRIRHKVFSLHDRESASYPLDFSTLEMPEEDEYVSRPTEFGSATTLIFVAYDCTARGGLQHIHVGEADLLEDGTVVWRYREELPLRALTEEDSTLTRVNDGEAPRFDDAAAPITDLTLRGPGEAAESEEIADPDDAAEDTGTENDDRT